MMNLWRSFRRFLPAKPAISNHRSFDGADPQAVTFFKPICSSMMPAQLFIGSSAALGTLLHYLRRSNFWGRPTALLSAVVRHEGMICLNNGNRWQRRKGLTMPFSDDILIRQLTEIAASLVRIEELLASKPKVEIPSVNTAAIQDYPYSTAMTRSPRN